MNAPGKDVTKAVLTEGAREALQGDRLISQEGDTPLTFAPHAPKSNIDGQIIAVADEATQIGQYQVVVVNRGAQPRPRAGRGARRRPEGRSGAGQVRQAPVGEGSARGRWCSCRTSARARMIVFKVFDRVSYGLVIGARGPMQVADRVYNP